MLFGITLGLTLGLLFHSAFGRRLWQLPFFLVAALFGVFAGQVAGTIGGWNVLAVGNVPVVVSSAGALMMLGLCWFFTSPLRGERDRLKRRARRAISGDEHASA